MSTGPGAQIMQDVPALLIKQKMDKLEILCPALQKRNKYKIAALTDINHPEFDKTWSKNAFKAAPELLKAKEESDCLCRVCFMNYREFTMDIEAEATGNVVYKIMRPFKCTMMCCCFMLNPQELTITDDQGSVIGRTVQDFQCVPFLCGKQYFKVEDKGGDVQYNIERNMCCNDNCCNPACPCLCPVQHFSIMSADMTQEVGGLDNIFPGCNFEGLCSPDTDNYKLTFPTDSSPDQKAMLLGATILIEYLLFEKGAEEK